MVYLLLHPIALFTNIDVLDWLGAMLSLVRHRDASPRGISHAIHGFWTGRSPMLEQTCRWVVEKY
jgi:hypothetical protein